MNPCDGTRPAQPASSDGALPPTPPAGSFLSSGRSWETWLSYRQTPCRRPPGCRTPPPSGQWWPRHWGWPALHARLRLPAPVSTAAAAAIVAHPCEHGLGQGSPCAACVPPFMYCQHAIPALGRQHCHPVSYCQYRYAAPALYCLVRCPCSVLPVRRPCSVLPARRPCSVLLACYIFCLPASRQQCCNKRIQDVPHTLNQSCGNHVQRLHPSGIYQSLKAHFMPPSSALTPTPAPTPVPAPTPASTWTLPHITRIRSLAPLPPACPPEQAPETAVR